MQSSFLPIFTVPSDILNGKTVFHKINEKVVIHSPGKLLRKLINLCDGTCLVSEVISLLSADWDAVSVSGLIKELQRREVLVDNRAVSSAFWTTLENPSRFPSLLSADDVDVLVEKSRLRHKKDRPTKVYQVPLTAFGQLLRKRRSVRKFSGEAIDMTRVLQIIWASYGEVSSQSQEFSRRTVPSAGALYPLKVYVVLFKQTGDLQPGVYSAWLGKSSMVGFKLISTNLERFCRSFADPMMFVGAHGVVVIAGDLRVTTEKYGNRGMLYTILEAGYAAQNLHLAALELGIGTVELGGFIDQLISEALVLPKNIRPLTTVVFGCERKIEVEYDVSKLSIESYWPTAMAAQYRLPFSMAFARVSSKNNLEWSSGRSVVPQEAYVKAVAEAKEWYACGLVPKNLVQAKFSDLNNALDPRNIVGFHQSQYRLRGFPFKPFDETLSYSWVQGTNELNGKKVWVLADCIYFPYYPKTPPYMHANSSGVAAHPDRLQAIKNGVHELIERDSFMIAYLAKLAFPSISESNLPASIQKRIRSLRENGFKVCLKDQTLGLAPDVFVFAQNESLSFTTCAGCSRFDVESALDHALMEVESSVLYRLTHGAAKSIKLADVKFPSDHGTLYEQKKFFRKADFMFLGGKTVAFRQVGNGSSRSWQELLDRFKINGWPLVTVKLNLAAHEGLHVIRSIVPGMVPISFGHQLEPFGMRRLREVVRQFGGYSISYRGMTKFPHPYT